MLNKLRAIYDDETRDATPREVHDAIERSKSEDFKDLEKSYPPNEEDIKEKGDKY